MPYALLLFIIMPIVEIAVLLNVGSAIGWLPTIALVILTAVIGTQMLRQQGLSTLARARTKLDHGEMPADEVVEGMLLGVGGAMLLTPGFITDAFGFLCLIPPTRAWLARRVMERSSVVVMGGSVTSPGAARTAAPDAVKPSPRPTVDRHGNRIIEGDYEEID
ncbi:MAG: hypothetical protein CSB44_11310 [Gammaproteobacteria bacterium]|nr:MAG: hypothetical protein CSB44_11310 [Gammaproteobacteria bacterium]